MALNQENSEGRAAPRKSPDAFRTISEVADDLQIPQHVLRFWETKFPQLKPLKRGGGRRYYRPDDVELLKGIRHLLYDQGYTIKGVQKLLKTNGNKFVMAVATGDVATMEALVAANASKADEPKVNLDEDQVVGRPDQASVVRRKQERDPVPLLHAPHQRQDGSTGLAAQAPFDAILLTGSLAEAPQALLDQLKVGGRLLAILGQEPVMQATLFTRVAASQFSRQELFDTVAARLPGFPEPSRFQF